MAVKFVISHLVQSLSDLTFFGINFGLNVCHIKKMLDLGGCCSAVASVIEAAYLHFIATKLEQFTNSFNGQAALGLAGKKPGG